jgi:hypothetical protein
MTSHFDMTSLFGNHIDMIISRNRYLFAFGVLLFVSNVSVARSEEEPPKFFASIDACIASGEFLKKECRAAFYNSELQLRDRSPKFSSMSECRFRFQICEIQTPDLSVQSDEITNTEEDYKYIPVPLGVEITRSNDGLYATSVLAVETPTDLFPKFLLTGEYNSDVLKAASANAYSAIRPSDFFEPFPSLKNSIPINKFVIKNDKSKNYRDIAELPSASNDINEDFDLDKRQVSASQSASRYLD